jgi:hypothetical protein
MIYSTDIAFDASDQGMGPGKQSACIFSRTSHGGYMKTRFRVQAPKGLPAIGAGHHLCCQASLSHRPRTGQVQHCRGREAPDLCGREGAGKFCCFPPHQCGLVPGKRGHGVQTEGRLGLAVDYAAARLSRNKRNWTNQASYRGICKGEGARTFLRSPLLVMFCCG